MKPLRLLVFLASLLPLFVFAEPIAVAEKDGVKITLFDDDCTQDAVANLPLRAEWVENGKTFEGCWSPTPFGLVVAYFSDKTIALIRAGLFKEATGI